MNPLQFLPKDIENIIIDYKNEFEKYEHKKGNSILRRQKRK